VTRFHQERVNGSANAGGTSERGEYQREDVAYEVARALAESERQALGYTLDDSRMKYPEPPEKSE
jgi:hypothetical protein